MNDNRKPYVPPKAKTMPIDAIVELLGRDELLCQLAEEASELAQAALKLRRAYSKKNPTPKTVEQCVDNLLEEIGDVSVCCTALGYDSPLNRSRISAVYSEKVLRWAERLEENHAE